jgi:catechol 2,3-dioxygenase-like lactoylglutathione lyase family enzyme
MAAPSPLIDHVVVNVLDRLDAATETYRRLGFHLTPRGHHTLGSSNTLAVFGTDYLELLGFEPGRGTPRADIAGHLAGLGGLVLKPPAAPQFAAGLRARGVPASAPREFSRPVALPGGARDACFRVVDVEGAVPGGRVFFCHHHTPELVWRDEWRRHRNAATGVAEVAIAAEDPARAAAPFAQIFGPGAIQPTEGGLALQAGRAEILFLGAAELARRYGPAALAGEGGTRMAALGLRTASLGAARAALAAHGAAGVAERGGRLLVPADRACGVALAFRE